MPSMPCRLKYKICTPHSAATVVRRIKPTKGLRDGWNSRPGSKKLHPRDTLPLSKPSSSCSSRVPYHQYDYSSRLLAGGEEEERKEERGERESRGTIKKLNFMLKYQECIGFMHCTGIVRDCCRNVCLIFVVVVVFQPRLASEVFPPTPPHPLVPPPRQYFFLLIPPSIPVFACRCQFLCPAFLVEVEQVEVGLGGGWLAEGVRWGRSRLEMFYR